MPTADALLQYWPGWAALLFAGLLTLNKLLEESEKFARFLGPIGRSLRKRALKRHQFDIAAAHIAMAVQQAVAKAREEWERDENEAIIALDQRLSTVSQVTAQQSLDLEAMRFQVQVMTAYTEYEAMWHQRLQLAIAAAGGELRSEDIPGHMDYFQFEKKYKRNTNWRRWAFTDE